MHTARILFILLAGCAASGGAASRPVEILEPLGDEPVRGTVDVVVAVAPEASATSVELWVDGGLRIADWSGAMPPSLTAELDTTILPDGVHELLVVGERADGTHVSAVRPFVIDNVGAEVTIEEPIDRVFHEDGPFALVVRVADAARLETLMVRVDGRIVAEISPVLRERNVITVEPTEYLPADATHGRVVLEAEALDTTGNTTTAQKTIDIASRRLWAFSTLGRVWEAPELLWDEAVAVVTSEGVLHVVEPDGTERCHVRADGERGGSSPTYLPMANAIVWGTTHHLRVTSAETCAQLYVDAIAREFVAKPTVTEAGVIHAVTFDGTSVSFNADGSGRRVTELAALVAGGSAIEARSALVPGPDGSVYVAAKIGSTGGALFALRADATVDVVDLTAPVESDLYLGDQGIYFGGTDGAVYAYSFELTRIWVAVASDIAGIHGRPIFDGNAVVAEDGEGRVHGRDPATGAVTWEYDALLERAPTGLGLIGRAGLDVGPAGDVVFGDALGMLHVLGPNGALFFRARVTPGGVGEGIVARPAVRSDRVYVGTESQTLVSYILR